MTSIHRVRAVWTGFPGGPGVTTLYTLETSGFLTSFYDFLYGIRSYIPNDVSINIEGTGDTIEDTTGALLSAWVEDPPATIDCDNAFGYAAPAGEVVDWVTSTILDGRRLRGRSFIVPIAADQFAADGSLDDTKRVIVESLAQAFVDAQAGSFVIWHRPRAAKAADGSRKAVTARSGGHALVTAAHVPDEACVLRSRRD